MKCEIQIWLRVLVVSLLLCSSLPLAQTEKLTEKPAESPKPSAVMLDNILTKLKLKGRAALAYYNSGDTANNNYTQGTLEVPDIKLVLGFEPDTRNSLTIRFNINNGIAQTPFADYAYLQCKDFIPVFKDKWYSPSTRIGRFKLGVGEETHANNSIEGVLPSNSAANVDGSDEGIELSGKFFAVSVGNGNRGFGGDNNSGKAVTAKLFFTPINPLYLSTTYYHSGQLRDASAEISVAGVVAPVTNTLRWKRQVATADIRYDFKRGKKPLNPPALSDSKAFIRFSFGWFDDDMKLASSTSTREGFFGFGEFMYQLTSKIYMGVRASSINLNDSQTASLNGLTTNHYERYSGGVGYRWSDNVHIKVGYDHNRNGGAGTSDNSSDDLFSALLAVRL